MSTVGGKSRMSWSVPALLMSAYGLPTWVVLHTTRSIFLGCLLPSGRSSFRNLQWLSSAYWEGKKQHLW